MIKKSILVFASIMVMGLTLFGQDSKVLLTIDGDMKVSLDEFLWMYQKTNDAASSNMLSPEVYLESYTAFKLKVKDAEELGLESDIEFKNELDEYSELLLQSYLIHRFTEGELVHEAYERMKQDVNASHILLRLPQDASPEDTLEVYEKILQIRKKILAGSNFEAMARNYSDDPSAKLSGGDLGYFSVFSMDYPFENAAYELPVGEVSMPVRSRYGYHLVKVHQRRPAQGMIRIAHIFIRSTEEMSPQERNMAEMRIRQAYDSLSFGRSFSSQVAWFSEDQRTAQSGGELPMMGVGQMDPAFEKIAFGIQSPGNFSQPFSSEIGWHIVQLLEKTGYGSFAEMEPGIKARVKREQRLEYHQDRNFAQFKETYGFEEFLSALDIVYAEADSSLLAGTWDGSKLQSNQTALMEAGNTTLSVGDFVEYVVEKQDAGRRAREAKYYINELYKQYRRVSCYQVEESMVPEKYPEFNFQLQEYHDGLLLFRILDQKVWSKALIDTAGLETYFEAHRENYMWKERTDAIIVTCTGGADLQEVRKKYKKILSGSYDEARLNEKFCNSDSAECISRVHILSESGVYPRVDELKGRPGPGPVYTNSNSKGFVIIREVRPPESKDLKEAKGQVVSDYQKYLEEQWIKELREKYPVHVNREVLNLISPEK